MSDWVWILLITLWVGWATQGVLAAFMVGKYYSLLRHPRREGFASYRPRAAVVVPFKGVEPALTDNLAALLRQDYPDYRVVLVVESEDDSAYQILKSFAGEHPGRARVLLSGSAGPNEGQKVHNLLAAIDSLEREDHGEAVWVFADSDAVPGPSWLGDLVGPLVQERTGVSTGYRWLIPEPTAGQARPSFWSHVASILNASAAGFVVRERLSHAWGGSMAMRVQTARALGLRDWLTGAISDDYQVTRMVRSAGLRVYFVARCLVPSPVSFDGPGFVEFVRRQYMITRVHAPRVFYGGLGLLLHYQLGLWSAIAAVIGCVAWGDRWREEPGFWLAISALAVVAGANQARALIRRRIVRRAFGDETARKMRRTHLIDHTLTPVWMTLNLALLLSAAVGRTITWRGITYRMRGPRDVQKL